MMALIRNGGFPMWFILAFGLVGLGAAALHAARPAAARLGFIQGMALATLFSTLTGIAADLAAVFTSLPDQRAEIPAADLPWLVMRGLGESMSPAIVGFTLLSLMALLFAVGSRRAVPITA